MSDVWVIGNNEKFSDWFLEDQGFTIISRRGWPDRIIHRDDTGYIFIEHKTDQRRLSEEQTTVCKILESFGVNIKVLHLNPREKTFDLSHIDPDRPGANNVLRYLIKEDCRKECPVCNHILVSPKQDIDRFKSCPKCLSQYEPSEEPKERMQEPSQIFVDPRTSNPVVCQNCGHNHYTNAPMNLLFCNECEKPYNPETIEQEQKEHEARRKEHLKKSMQEGIEAMRRLRAEEAKEQPTTEQGETQ